MPSGGWHHGGMAALSLTTPEARRAYDLAVSLLADDSPAFQDAVLRYARAVDRAALTRIEWESHGRPMMLQHTNGALYDHPLVRQLRAAERDAATYAKQLEITPATESWQRRAARQEKQRRDNLPF